MDGKVIVVTVVLSGDCCRVRNVELSGFTEFLLGSIFLIFSAVARVVDLVLTSVLFTELTKLVRRLRFLRDTFVGGIHTSTLVWFLGTSLGFRLCGLDPLFRGLIFHHFLDVLKNRQEFSHTRRSYGVLLEHVLILPRLRHHL